MQLKVLGSSSAGNCYILENQKEALIIEAGVRIETIKEALNFNLNKVSGCIISHEHGDHAGHAVKLATAGINVYASIGTITERGWRHHRFNIMHCGAPLQIGNFTVLPFDVKHDAAQPLGFLIYHRECGNVLFVTDTYAVPYKFKGLNQILIEANYDQNILDRNVTEAKINYKMRERVMLSHMDIETTSKILAENNLTEVSNIVLIHLSPGNSDSEQFKKRIENETGKSVSIARSGVDINFNLTPI